MSLSLGGGDVEGGILFHLKQIPRESNSTIQAEHGVQPAFPLDPPLFTC